MGVKKLAGKVSRQEIRFNGTCKILCVFIRSLIVLQVLRMRD